jgi:predicted enzyme related to lactoylglutathione lyase
MPNPVVHFEVLGKDAEATQGFYAKIFDWPMEKVMDTYAMVKPGGETGIAGGVGAMMQGAPGHSTFYVEVDDLQAKLDAIEAAGGSTVQPPMDVPNGPSIALFKDPDGNLVGLVKYTHRPGARGATLSPRMADTGKIAKNLERFAQAVAAHDRENPTHTAYGIGLAHFDLERLDLEQGEEILPGIRVEVDGGVSGNFRVLCDGQHDEGQIAVEQEVVQAVSVQALPVVVSPSSPGSDE